MNHSHDTGRAAPLEARTELREVPSIAHLFQASAKLSPDNNTSPALSTPSNGHASPAGPSPGTSSVVGPKRNREGAAKASPTSEVDDMPRENAKNDKKEKRVKVGARASIACKTCRRRKVRCSGEWPVCAFCTRRNMQCVYEGHPAASASNSGSIAQTTNGVLILSEVDAALPPAADIVEALEVFFLHNYETFYFLHRLSLTESINKGTAPRELVCCILAFAARFSEKLRSGHNESPYAASEHYASLAAQLLSRPTSRGQGTSSDSSHDPEITLVRCQSFLMLGLYDCTASRENSGWLKIGHAIRMAQVLRLGFEDEVENSNNARPARDQIQSEERRRTFWACFLMDRTVSDGKERPCIMKAPLPSALRMPSSDADWSAMRASQGARFDPNPPLWSISVDVDLSAEPEADLYGLTLRIAELWQKVANYIGSGGRNIDRRAPWLPESTFAVLQRELLIFEERLPTVFKYNEANLTALSMIGGQVRLFGMLHLLFETAKLVLHRDYLPFLPPPNFRAGEGPADGEPLYGDAVAPAGWWQTSFNFAANAARNVAEVLSGTAQHGAMVTHPFAGFSALASATIHLHLKYWPQSSDVPVNNAYHIEQTTMILTALRDVYPIAIGWCDGLAKLQLLYYNLVRGVLDVDPAKVRASVVQLLRTSKDDEHGHTNGKSGDDYQQPVTRNELPRPALESQSSSQTDTLHDPLGSTAHPALDLNTEFDFLLPNHVPGTDPFDMWGNGGWADFSLLHDSTWPHGSGTSFAFN